MNARLASAFVLCVLLPALLPQLPAGGQAAWRAQAAAPGSTPTPRAARPTGWYRFQGEAGAAYCPPSACGAAAVAMAIAFAHNGQQVNVNDVSKYMRICANGGSSYVTAGPALDHWRVQRGKAGAGMAGLQTALNRGHVVLAILSMSAISRGTDYLVAGSSPAQHFGRYYSYTGGHFVVVTGISADKKWVIVNDPYVFSASVYWYGDGTAKGEQRYYAYSEFARAYSSPGIEVTPDPPAKGNGRLYLPRLYH